MQLCDFFCDYLININGQNLYEYITDIQNHEWLYIYTNMTHTKLLLHVFFSETLKSLFHDVFPMMRVKER